MDIILQIPNTDAADIRKLDEKISLGATRGNKIDKAKKDLFKKITAPVSALRIRIGYSTCLFDAILFFYFTYAVYQQKFRPTFSERNQN